MSKYFRRPTGRGKIKGPDTFIQLERKRIITPGEKREISLVGVASRRVGRISGRVGGRKPMSLASFTPSFTPKKSSTNFLKSSKLKSGRRTFF